MLYGLKRNVFCLLVIGALSSCSQQPGPPVASGTPAPVATAAQPSPPAMEATPIDSRDVFVAVTERYEQEIDPAQNGYPLLEPILSSQLPEGLGEDLEMVGLDSPEQVKMFDSRLLPTLEAGFRKEIFIPEGRLMAGSADINYRGLRHLVSLVVFRAEQLRDEGDVKKALELVALPITLAGAMQSRPETVSVNLFSAGYASSALTWIQSTLETGALDQNAIGELQKLLADHSPGYAHVKETITVDFAQLTNSLETDEGRQMMGIGQVEDATLAQWRRQLAEIYRQATTLYQAAPMDADAFNKEVLRASGPIQGLVIDYPAMATMQKRYFAEYKATELGLALVGPEAAKWKEVKPEELIETFYSDDPESADALKALIKIEREGDSVKIAGKMEQFELLAPGVEPILFEFQPSGTD